MPAALTLTGLGAVTEGFTLTLGADVAVGDRIFVVTPGFPRETIYGEGIGNHVGDAGSNAYSADAFDVAWSLLDYSQVTTPLAAGDVVTLNHGGSLSFAENNGFLNPATGAAPGLPCGVAFKVSGHDSSVTWIKERHDRDASGTTYKASTDALDAFVGSSGPGTHPGATFYVTAAPPSGTPEQLTLFLVSQYTATAIGAAADSAPSAITTPTGFTLLGSATTTKIRNLGNDYQIRMDLYYRVRAGGTDGPLVLPPKTYPATVNSLRHIYYGWNTYQLSLQPEGVVDVSQARGHSTGRLLIAYTDTAGAVKVNRYNDNLPPTVAATVTLETAGGTGVSLAAKGEHHFDLYYAQSGTVKRRTTKDAGRTWSVATTIATGYQDVSHVVDRGRKIELVALWKESESRWYIAVGTLQADDTYGAHSTPTTLVSSAKRGGSLIREGNGHFSFAYRTSADVVSVVRCSAISKTGTGSWT